MSAMTVEHSQVDYVPNQRQTLFNQLKEITGVGDEAALEQALQASRIEGGKYDLTHAVNILFDAVNVLVDENGVRSGNCEIKAKVILDRIRVARRDVDVDVEGSVPIACISSSKNVPKDTSNVVDLTNEVGLEKEALQKAIALSLQEQQRGMLGGQVSTEERDISKVLEQILIEAKAGTKRKHEEVWQDPRNPHERKRIDQWPVGLKNVGNTCWFSSVIQSLFHLPVFQKLVLSFVPPEMDKMAHSAGRRNLLFLQELRRLFALMVGSERKYVDPSKAIEILKESFHCGSSDSQQDVSEFTHKLIEWLEDAFRGGKSEKLSAGAEARNDEEEKCGKERLNPMVDLFYGRFRSEGQNDGHLFSNEETFGQYPLQVNGFCNIHNSLEAATAQEIESGIPGQETGSKSGQEVYAKRRFYYFCLVQHWFTKLPPVLIFELSRFQFNQQLGRPEKIHNKFDFPEVIYMDRYVEVNKNITKTKRDEVHKMRESREELQNKLDKYTNYGSGCKRFPLQDILQYTLEFVETNPVSGPSSLDVSLPSPCSVLSMNTDSPCNSPAQNTVSDSASKRVCEKVGNCLPEPKHVSDSELEVLRTCLKRWRTEVEHDIRSLQDGLNSLDQAISCTYNEPTLQKLPYRLHAVLVHEGQAASGHYWAYVYNHKSKTWMKFNDITVTESTWVELQKESVGGYQNASAYCLMYIDCNKRDLVDDVVAKENEPENFPSDMHQLVNEDNSLFHKEMLDWDHQENLCDSECEADDWDIVSAWDSQTKLDNYLFDVLEQTIDQGWDENPKIHLHKAIEQEQIRLEKAAKETLDGVADARLCHVLVYILVLQPEMPLVCRRLNLLQHFANLQPRENKDNSYHEKIKNLALLCANILKTSKGFQAHRKQYNELLDDYKKFRFVAKSFLLGLDQLKESSFYSPRNNSVEATIVNEQLMKKYNNQLSCVRHKNLITLRRKTFLSLSSSAVAAFTQAYWPWWSDALKLMHECVVPFMYLLCAPNAAADDVAAAETIRASWCSMLGEEMCDGRREALEKLLVKLLDLSEPKIKQKFTTKINFCGELTYDFYKGDVNKEFGLITWE